ncbi:MAG: helix-turn-helix transcriptional regulator [Acidimicrobiales bacterium]
MPRKSRVDAPLNSTAASLLGFLQPGEATGYELAQVAEMVIGDFWSITRSQVYRELADLAERGFVEEGETGPRARRPYQLTPAGRAAFGEWIARPPGSEQIRFPLLLTMSFGDALGPTTILGFVDQHRVVHELRLAGYEAKRDAPVEPYLDMVLAFGIHYERAVLAWTDEVRASLSARLGRVTDAQP